MDVVYPIAVRNAFYDNLTAMKAFEIEVVRTLSKSFMCEVLNDSTFCAVRRNIKDIWQKRFHEGVVNIDAEWMPEFQVFERGHALYFEWDKP